MTDPRETPVVVTGLRGTVAHLRGILERATPGPWEALKGVEQSDDMRCGVTAARGSLAYLVATIENGAPGDICDTEFANAELIAAMRNALPALLDAADRDGWEVGREQIEAGLSSFCRDEPDFTMSSAMRQSAADHILAQPLLPASPQLAADKGEGR